VQISTMRDGRWKVRFPYNAQAVERIKASVPWYERQWEPRTKAWIVTPSDANEKALRKIDNAHFGGRVAFPQSATMPIGIQFAAALEIQYIGIPKDRNGKMASSGMLRNAPDRKGWRVIFPEDVLKAWFIPGWQSAGTQTAADTLYSILGIKPDADARGVKTAYRQAAKTWHPDINSDPMAGTKFIEIDDAYKLLRDPLKRKRYDAGLALVATMINPPVKQYSSSDWRPPIRCGIIVCEGKKIGDFYHVEKIARWAPITNDHGQTLVTTWPFGASESVENWI